MEKNYFGQLRKNGVVTDTTSNVQPIQKTILTLLIPGLLGAPQYRGSDSVPPYITSPFLMLLP